MKTIFNKEIDNCTKIFMW